jgi:hypothetical protein
MVDRVEGELRFEPDIITVFPLERDDPLVAFQRAIEVNSVDEIIDFAFVRAWDFSLRERSDLRARMRDNEDLRRRGSFLTEESPLSLEELLVSDSIYYAPKWFGKDAFAKYLGKLFGSLTEVRPTEFVVPAGATVEFNGLSRISADRVIIEGTVNARGHLVIEADELRGNP